MMKDNRRCLHKYEVVIKKRLDSIGEIRTEKFLSFLEWHSVRPIPSTRHFPLIIAKNKTRTR